MKSLFFWSAPACSSLCQQILTDVSRNRQEKQQTSPKLSLTLLAQGKHNDRDFWSRLLFWATYPKATLLWSTAFVVQQARRQTDVPPALPLLWLQHRHRFSHSQVFLAALKQDSSKKNLYSVLKQRGWHKPHFICTNTLYSCIFHSVLCVSCDKVVWHPSGER